jgi:hypothetical protein
MKKRKLKFGLATVVGLVGSYFLHNRATFLFVLAQGDCCSDVPRQPSSTPRFPQGAQVTRLYRLLAVRVYRCGATANKEWNRRLER